MTLPLCVRIEADDTRSADALKADGWREIEVLETWRGNTIWPPPTVQGVEPKESDHGAICAVIRRSFVHDRLHTDPLVSPEEADEAKEQWARDALTNPEKKVRIIRSSTGNVVAVLIYKTANHTAIIDLIAVEDRCRGFGFGKALIIHTFSGNQFLSYLQAGTQSTNMPAQSLYARLCMTVVRRQTTWHKP